MVTKNKVKREARKAEDSDHVDRLARFGLVCRGLVWSVVGVLVLDVAVGGGARADKNGALRLIKDQPLGEVLLVLLGLGFIGYALWRLLQGAVGHRDADEGLKRWGKRVASLFRGGIYAGLAWSTLHFLFVSDQADKTGEWASKAMELPGGRVLVGLAAVGVVAGGLYMSWRGVTADFEEKLKPVPKQWHEPVRVTGTIGLLFRGLVFAAVAGFVLAAALTYDPEKARGLDAAVKTLRDLPLGSLLIGVGGAGLVCFGLWSFAEARWRKI
jgi:hypothetical protein